MLEVSINGIKFKNPVIAASGTFGFGSEYNNFYDVGMLGGISSKGLTINPKEGNDGLRVVETASGMIYITLKYGEKKTRVITGLKRISKPGLRVYAKNDEVPKVLNGLGIAIISTSKGIMTDKEARKQNIGGEVLAYIW